MLNSISSDTVVLKAINAIIVPTSTCALPEELLDNLCLHIVAVVFCHHGTEFPKLSEETILMLEVTKLCRQGAALTDLGRGRD